MHFVVNIVFTQVDLRIISFMLSKKGLECVDSSEHSTE